MVFFNKNGNILEVKFNYSMLQIEVLETLEFTSDMNRMLVVVRGSLNGKIPLALILNEDVVAREVTSKSAPKGHDKCSSKFIIFLGVLRIREQPLCRLLYTILDLTYLKASSALVPVKPISRMVEIVASLGGGPVRRAPPVLIAFLSSTWLIRVIFGVQDYGCVPGL
ncbi:hypothetical protein RJT34_11464 [Clitoria ternatea]|uniref:Uncharacterized protein n=1 Tax=Clitoria ternatea TaxID=43366 RepID=A0AAN9JM43_CLITE